MDSAPCASTIGRWRKLRSRKTVMKIRRTRGRTGLGELIVLGLNTLCWLGIQLLPRARIKSQSMFSKICMAFSKWERNQKKKIIAHMVLINHLQTSQRQISKEKIRFKSWENLSKGTLKGWNLSNLSIVRNNIFEVKYHLKLNSCFPKVRKQRTSSRK